MQQERLGNLGYFAFIKEAAKGTPLTPTNFLPIYSETLTTNANKQTQRPIYGGKFGTYGILPGQRDHQGDLSVLAEPNTTAQLAEFLLTHESSTGTDPATHVLGFSKSTNPDSATVDISLGNVVKRFFGVQFSSFTPDWSANELRHKIKASALGSFQSATIKTVTTTTVTLETKYDPRPTKGLVVGDLVRIFKESTGATLDTTIATVNADGVTITLGASAAAFAAGDILHLRPVTTPNFDLLDTFLWAKTQFRFGANAAAALAATHTPVEQGSTFEILHPFKEDAGEKRSGSFDPAALVRLAGDASLQIKKFFDTPEDVQDYNDMTKRACVIRHFAGDNNQYEYRIAYHNLTVDTPVANVVADEINYATQNLLVSQDATDGKAVTLTVINALETL